VTTKHRTKHRTQQAFTLIEMVMVITIMSVLFVSIAPIFAQGLTASRLVTEHSNSMSKLQLALERIAREIRQVDHNGSNYNFTTWTASQIVFSKNDSASTVVDIRQSGSLLKLKFTNLSLNVDSDLTNELSSLAFRYLTITDAVAMSIAEIAFVEISLSRTNPSNSTSYSQRTRVALRDLS